MNTSRLSDSLDSYQARHYFGPDLGPNCLHSLSADDTDRQRVKGGFKISVEWFQGYEDLLSLLPRIHQDCMIWWH